MSEEIIQSILTFIAPVIAAFAGWLFGKRKIKADAEAGELDNVEKALSIYRKALADMEEWKRSLLERMVQIEKENERLIAELKNAHFENTNLRKRIVALEKEIATLKKSS